MTMFFRLGLHAATADIPKGTELTLYDSLGVALFCMAVVFAVLACLFLLIKIFSVGVRMIEGHSLQSDPSSTTDATLQRDVIHPGIAFSGLSLQDVDEPTAAMIMAIVSDESGIPLSELSFKSIQKKS